MAPVAADTRSFNSARNLSLLVFLAARETLSEMINKVGLVKWVQKEKECKHLFPLEDVLWSYRVLSIII